MNGYKGSEFRIVQFGRAFDVEHADVREFSHDPPKMKPLSLQLQFPRPLVLQRPELFDLLGLGAGRNTNIHIYMEQHAIFPRLRPKRRS